MSEDPIATSVTCRLAIGGLGSNAKEADVKKNNYPVFAAPKHVIKPKVDTIDLEGPSSASPSKQLKTPQSAAGFKSGGLKAPTKLAGGVKPSPRTESKKNEA